MHNNIMMGPAVADSINGLALMRKAMLMADPVLGNRTIRERTVIAYARLSSNSPNAKVQLTSQFDDKKYGATILIDKDDAFAPYAVSQTLVKAPVNAQDFPDLTAVLPYHYPELLKFTAANEASQLLGLYNGSYQFMTDGVELTKKLSMGEFLRFPTRLETATGFASSPSREERYDLLLRPLILSGNQKEYITYIFPDGATTSAIGGVAGTDANLVRVEMKGWLVEQASEEAKMKRDASGCLVI